MDLSTEDTLLPPLPSAVMGLDASVNFLGGSFIPQSGDQFIMVSRSSLPENFFMVRDGSYDIPKMTKILADDNPEIAFWIGLLTL